MLNADNHITYLSVRELKRCTRSKRPLIFWIGAGASKWLGYPLWKDLARDLRREFFKFVAGFDNAGALKLIDSNSFPRFFQRCRDLDRARYHHFLSNTFLPRPETPLYKRFVDALGGMAPLNILTTNVDEALEQRFPSAGVYQRSDIGGCIEQLQSGKPFIAKLHGSRSAIENAVFTHEDYESLKADTSYISVLRQVFTFGTVVFLGYSVSDQYLINLLSDNAQDMSLFGAGPHFVVSADFKGTSSLRQIGYSLKRFPDHRSALTVLDIIREVQTTEAEPSTRIQFDAKETGEEVSVLGTKTAYFISDFVPPGTWRSSVTAKFEAHGVKAEMTVGLGFTNDEIPFRESPAPHDLVVGLVCFDFVYFSLSALHKVHDLVGSEFFWQLVEADIIRFVHLQHEPAIIGEEGALIRNVGLISIFDTTTGQTESAGRYIRRQITPVSGKESVAEKLISDLEK